MDGTAVEVIASLAQKAAGKLVTVDEITYSATPLHDVRKPDPLPEPLRIHTLSGLVDFTRDNGVLDDHSLQVVSHSEVRLIDRALSEGYFRQRAVYAVASFEPLIGATGFAFGRFMAVEDFVVALQSLFVEDSGARANVLRLVSGLRDEAVRTSTDDGVSQAATSRTGVQVVAEVVVKNPVALTPFRTFREIEQPTSLFILRLRGGKTGSKGEPGEQPQVALFEADGGAWRLDAIKRTAEYLRTALPAFLVIA